MHTHVLLQMLETSNCTELGFGSEISGMCVNVALIQIALIKKHLYNIATFSPR